MLQCRLGVETFVGVQTAGCIRWGALQEWDMTHTHVTDGHCTTLPLVGHRTTRSSAEEHTRHCWEGQGEHGQCQDHCLSGTVQG